MANNFYGTLAMKALEHPQGLEVLKEVGVFRDTQQVKQQPEIQAEEPSDPLLKKNAYNLAKALGIFTPKHINHMTNSELTTWISEKSTLL